MFLVRHVRALRCNIWQEVTGMFLCSPHSSQKKFLPQLTIGQWTPGALSCIAWHVIHMQSSVVFSKELVEMEQEKRGLMPNFFTWCKYQPPWVIIWHSSAKTHSAFEIFTFPLFFITLTKFRRNVNSFVLVFFVFLWRQRFIYSQELQDSSHVAPGN